MYRFMVLLLFLFSISIARNTSRDTARVYIVGLEFWGEKCADSEELCGIYPDIFRELSRRMGMPIKMVIAPYPRVVNTLQNGAADFTVTLPKEQKDTAIRIGSPLWTIELGVLSLKSKPIQRLSQLKGLRVGTIRDAAFNEEFDKDTTIKKVSSVQHKNLLRMMKMGRIDAIASDLGIMRGIVETTPDLAMDFAEPLQVNALPLHFMMSSKSPFIRRFDEIDSVLVEMKEDKTIQTIILNHLQ